MNTAVLTRISVFLAGIVFFVAAVGQRKVLNIGIDDAVGGGGANE